MPSLRCVSMAASLLLYALLTSCVFATQARALRRGLDSEREANGTWRGAGLVHYVPGGVFYGGHAHVRPAVSNHRLYSHSNGISSGAPLHGRRAVPRQPRLHPLAMAGGGSPPRSDLPDGVNKSDGAADDEKANAVTLQVGTKAINVITRWTKLAKEMRRTQDADIIGALRSDLSKMRFRLENGWPVLVFALTADTRGGPEKIQALSMIHFNMVPDRYGNIHYLAEELDLPKKPRSGETKIFVVELLAVAVKPTMASSQRQAVEAHLIRKTRLWSANTMGCMTVLGRPGMLKGKNVSTRKVDIVECVVGDDDAGMDDQPGLHFIQLDAGF